MSDGACSRVTNGARQPGSSGAGADARTRATARGGRAEATGATGASSRSAAASP